MVNHLSRGLLAMSLFALVSWAVGSSVVCYPLFGAGVAAIMLADLTNGGRSSGFSRKRLVLACIVTSCIGFLFAPHLALALILPAALSAVLLADAITVRRNEEESRRSSREEVKEDPVTSLCISLPSAVALIAAMALA